MRGNGSKTQAHRRADDRVEITTDAGERVWAAAPVIVSASRATDIPACYTEWFFRRLQRGYAVRRNPFNNTRVPVSFARTRVIVFWSKKSPPAAAPASGSWRNGRSTASSTTRSTTTSPRVSSRASRRSTNASTPSAPAPRGWGATGSSGVSTPCCSPTASTSGNSCTGSGVWAIGSRDTPRNSSSASPTSATTAASPPTSTGPPFAGGSSHPPKPGEFAAGVRELNRRWGLDLATCGEPADLSRYGITHNRCIDDSLLVRLFPGDRVLMEHLGAAPGTLFGPADEPPHRKDPGQRPACGCCPSRDIGGYGTCPPRLPLLLRQPLARAGACRIPPPGRKSRQRKSRITDTGTYWKTPDAAGTAPGCIVPCGTRHGGDYKAKR